MSNIEAVESNTLSTPYDHRYVIVDNETGEIIDNAQGYGYKSKRNAYAAYGYKRKRYKQKLSEKINQMGYRLKSDNEHCFHIKGYPESTSFNTLKEVEMWVNEHGTLEKEHSQHEEKNHNSPN